MLHGLRLWNLEVFIAFIFMKLGRLEVGKSTRNPAAIPLIIFSWTPVWVFGALTYYHV